MESNLKKCSNCKKNYDFEQYTKGDKILKTCLSCRNILKKCRNKTKCIHGKSKTRCRKCGGSSFCHHNKRKTDCKECGGSGICIHSKIKYDCKLCGGSAICIHNKLKGNCKECNNPIHITIKRMINSSKKKDIKYNRYDELNFVNYDYLKNLISESNYRCHYCQCEIQYTYYTDNLGTIERLNNNLGHIIGNCKIACRKCNYSKIGSTINPQF